MTIRHGLNQPTATPMTVVPVNYIVDGLSVKVAEGVLRPREGFFIKATLLFDFSHLKTTKGGFCNTFLGDFFDEFFDLHCLAFGGMDFELFRGLSRLSSAEYTHRVADTLASGYCDRCLRRLDVQLVNNAPVGRTDAKEDYQTVALSP